MFGNSRYMEPGPPDTAESTHSKAFQKKQNAKIIHKNFRIRQKTQDYKLKNDVQRLREEYLQLQQENLQLKVKQYVLSHLLETREKNIEYQASICKNLNSPSECSETVPIMQPTGAQIRVPIQQIRAMGPEELNKILELFYLELSSVYPEAVRQGQSSEAYQLLVRGMSNLWKFVYYSNWDVVNKIFLENVCNRERSERQKKYWETYKFTEQDILALSEVWSIQSDRLIKSYHERQNNDQPLVQHVRLLKQQAHECQSPVSLEKARKIQTKQFNRVKQGVQFEENLILEMETLVFWKVFGVLRATHCWLDIFPAIIDVFQIIQAALQQGVQRSILSKDYFEVLNSRMPSLSEKLAAQQLI